MPGEVGLGGKGRRSDWLEPKVGHGIAFVNKRRSKSRCFETVNEARPADGGWNDEPKAGGSAIQA
jgi:hypothetical protein